MQAVDSQLVLAVLGVLLAVTAHLSGLWKAPAGATEVEPRHDACLLELLKVLPLDVLAAEWQANERALSLRGARQPDAPTIHFRQLLLQELHHRDAVGVQRWLDEGATTSPTCYVQDDRDLIA